MPGFAFSPEAQDLMILHPPPPRKEQAAGYQPVSRSTNATSSGQGRLRLLQDLLEEEEAVFVAAEAAREEEKASSSFSFEGLLVLLSVCWSREK